MLGNTNITFSTRNKSGISAHPCIILYICYEEDGNDDDYGVDNDLLLISGHFSNSYSEVRYEFSYLRFNFSKFWGVLK